MPLTETNVYRLAAAKQSAKGTAASTPTRRFKMVGGAFSTDPQMGSENYSDGSIYGDATDWFNSILGSGSPGIEGGSDELAYLLWLYHGAENVTVPGTNAVKTVTIGGAPTAGPWRLTYPGPNGRTTTDFATTTAAAAVQTALEALPSIGAGNVAVTGSAGGPYTLAFQGALAKRPVYTMTATHEFTGGSSPGVTVAPTTAGVNATHVYTPQQLLGFWSTWWSSVGLDPAAKYMHKHNDGRIGGVQIEASTGTKALRVTPSLLTLDPAEQYTTEITTAMPTSPVLLYNEGAGTFKVNGVAMTGQSQFQIGMSQELQPVYGDDVIPHDVGRGTPALTLAVTIAADADALAHLNEELYGDSTPAAGTKPLKRVPEIGSYGFTLSKQISDAVLTPARTIASFAADFPGVRWQIPDAPGPNPDQGSAEIALAGQVRRLGVLDLYTLTVGCQSAAFTV